MSASLVVICDTSMVVWQTATVKELIAVGLWIILFSRSLIQTLLEILILPLRSMLMATVVLSAVDMSNILSSTLCILNRYYQLYGPYYVP